MARARIGGCGSRPCTIWWCTARVKAAMGFEARKVQAARLMVLADHGEQRLAHCLQPCAAQRSPAQPSPPPAWQTCLHAHVWLLRVFLLHVNPPSLTELIWPLVQRLSAAHAAAAAAAGASSCSSRARGDVAAPLS
jgi:hypothetical protein